MRSQALEDLFVQELEELYDAEKQIYKGLSAISRAASNSQLKSAFENHQKQTKNQIVRLEKAFGALEQKPRRGSADGVAGLIRQTRHLLDEDGYDRSVTDAGLLSNAQKIEHYEIAAYGCVRTHAQVLGYNQIASLLEESLKEEEETDALLTQIASESVNVSAAAAPFARARSGARHAVADASQREERGKMTLGRLAIGIAIGGILSVLLAQKGSLPRLAKSGDGWIEPIGG